MALSEEKRQSMLDGVEEFNILPMHKRKIREIARTSKKFSNSADFIKSSIEILMSWESKYPEDCMALIDSLRPFTPEQETYMKQTMKADAIEKNFGSLDIDRNIEENAEQMTLAQTDYDHMKLQGNYDNTVKYLKSLKITKPKNIIHYDGYPLLSTSYRRFLPIKLTVSMLAYLLESKKAGKVELKELRVHAYDLLEEYGTMIRRHEKTSNVKRNEKISTGLPNKSKSDDDEREVEAKIRIKDIQIGKTRNSRVLGGRHFEGALSATGLVYAFEEDGKEYVSLSELGKKFALIENPIFPKNDFSNGAISKKEAEFITKEIIPQRALEKKIIEKSMQTIKTFQKLPEKKRNSKYELDVLEKEIHEIIIQYVAKNPEESEKYNMSFLKKSDEKAMRKIKMRRLATMGRLTEIGDVKWAIDEESISKYSVTK
jgi:hypothetical protein